MIKQEAQEAELQNKCCYADKIGRCLSEPKIYCIENGITFYACAEWHLPPQNIFTILPKEKENA